MKEDVLAFIWYYLKKTCNERENAINLKKGGGKVCDICKEREKKKVYVKKKYEKKNV